MAVGVLGAACSVELAPIDQGQPQSGGSAGFGALAGAGGVAGSVTGGAAGSGATSAGAGGVSAGAGGVSAGAGGVDAATGGVAGAAGGGGDAGPGASLGSFDLGYYWATTEAEFSGVLDTNLYDSSCALIATVSAGFTASLKSIGTGVLSDGRVLAYDGSCACPTSPCYLVCDAAHPWGYGVQGKALVPFRSIAVDPTQISYGTSVYAPALDGVTVPGAPPWGGFVHDGCLHADDNGGTSATKTVSLFAALKADYQTLSAKLGVTSIDLYQGGTLCP
jgi:3D (Asp-Asp-Asp) domain-containing protein